MVRYPEMKLAPKTSDYLSRDSFPRKKTTLPYAPLLLVSTITF